MKLLLTVILIAAASPAYLQQTYQAQHIAGVSAGLFGSWLNFEIAVSDNIVINPEIGYVGGVSDSHPDGISVFLTTIAGVESRYYYNFNRRLQKGKKAYRNSANYFSLYSYYKPDLFTVVSRPYSVVHQEIGIIPKYGFRRNLTNHMQFEFSFGVGYAWTYKNLQGPAGNLDLRFRYSF